MTSNIFVAKKNCDFEWQSHILKVRKVQSSQTKDYIDIASIIFLCTVDSTTRAY